MDNRFNIYIDHLRDGSQVTISESVSPDFMDVCETELVFHHPVEVWGKAYIAGDQLVIKLTMATKATMPCAICNGDVQVELAVGDFLLGVELREIKGGVYHYQDVVIETLLLELPHMVECNQGNCPERKVLEKYTSKGSNQTPFSEL